MTARLVAIEGIDGSGKGTQAARLGHALTGDGLSCGIISFPRYAETAFGRTIARYLNGEFGDLQAAGPHFAALLYAGDRFESQPLISSALATHDVVIFDRYVPSNLAHQAAKLPPAEWAAFIEWLQTIEYGVYRLPRPDLVIYLDMPVRMAQQLIALKPARTYTTKRADLHESNGEYLGRTADVYRQLSQSDRTWKVIPCTSQDAVRPVESIAAEVRDSVREMLHAKST